MTARLVHAPAKVNLTLRVLGRRADGYHDLHSLMVPLSLADTLEVRFGGVGARLEVPERPELAGADNLCLVAVRAFEARFGQREVQIRLHKRIPVAAGLGGGSSDAGAVLRCLADEAGVPLDHPGLRDAALEVGSDVPFFLSAQPSIVTGRGERLAPAPLLPAPLPLVLVHPPFPIRAGDAYAALAASRGGAPPEPPAPLPPLRTPQEVAAILANDLQAPIQDRYPIGEALAALQAAGALGTLMSGSGPTVFGVFATEQEAQAAARSLSGHPGWGVWAVTAQPPRPTLDTP
jgi:4-diphosphocytidyl-2-C-methyl-D-erythritol kinase